jgi:hypothetical protein
MPLALPAHETPAIHAWKGRSAVFGMARLAGPTCGRGVTTMRKYSKPKASKVSYGAVLAIAV